MQRDLYNFQLSGIMISACQQDGSAVSESILIAYSTTDGHTVQICRRIQRVAEHDGHQVTLKEIPPDANLDIEPYNRIVIGASIRYGRHKPEVMRFIENNKRALERRRGSFFSVNAVARKAAKKTPETNPYVRKFLSQISWQPLVVGIFGGKIDYPAYGHLDRLMIRFIMWMTKGPTDPTGTFEFTDWAAVDDFGRKISKVTAGGSSRKSTANCLEEVRSGKTLKELKAGQE